MMGMKIIRNGLTVASYDGHEKQITQDPEEQINAFDSFLGCQVSYLHSTFQVFLELKLAETTVYANRLPI